MPQKNSQGATSSPLHRGGPTTQNAPEAQQSTPPKTAALCSPFHQLNVNAPQLSVVPQKAVNYSAFQPSMKQVTRKSLPPSLTGGPPGSPDWLVGLSDKSAFPQCWEYTLGTQDVVSLSWFRPPGIDHSESAEICTERFSCLTGQRMHN